MNIVIWGTGKVLEILLPILIEEKENILFFVDNDESKWGGWLNGIEICSPDRLSDTIFDKIIIAALLWKDIYNEIIYKYNVVPHKIENAFYKQRKSFLEYYNKIDNLNSEEIIVYDNIKKYPLDVFNYEFVNDYINYKEKIYYDNYAGLYYVYYKNKKMYMSRKFDSKIKISRYCRLLAIEQNINSPHCYLNQSFTVNNEDIVLDAGVAEGNFALSIIDKVSKIYLVESDKDWIEALKYTFAPYKDKVVIINKYLSDKHEGYFTNIDTIINNSDINFIKMDIEGAELEALKGATLTLKNNNINLDICIYHSIQMEKNVTELLNNIYYDVRTTPGFMVFVTLDNINEKDNIRMVRGLIQAKKR